MNYINEEQILCSESGNLYKDNIRDRTCQCVKEGYSLNTKVKSTELY